MWIDIFSEMSKKIDRMDGENQFNYKELYMCQIWCLLICQCVVFIIVKMSDEMVAWICFFLSSKVVWKFLVQIYQLTAVATTTVVSEIG